MKKAIWMMAAAALLALPACGGSDTSGTGSSGKSGSGGGGSTSGGSTTSGQTCTNNFSCINGSCTCSDGAKKDQACCDPNDDTCTDNKCDTYCKVCM